MDAVADLVARDRRSDALALATASRAGSYSYEKLCTASWKAGNLLRHYGVRGDATVGIVTGDSLTPPPLTAFLGAGLLGATVRIDPPAVHDARAIVLPANRVEAYDPAPGTQALAYGDAPANPTVAHFEREVWSENPTPPPGEVDPGAALLAVDDDRYAQRTLLSAAQRIASEREIDAADRIAVGAPLSDLGAVVAGVLAPLTAGAAILVDDSATGTVGVGVGDSADGSIPASRRIDPADARPS